MATATPYLTARLQRCIKYQGKNRNDIVTGIKNISFNHCKRHYKNYLLQHYKFLFFFYSRSPTCRHILLDFAPLLIIFLFPLGGCFTRRLKDPFVALPCYLTPPEYATMISLFIAILFFLVFSRLWVCTRKNKYNTKRNADETAHTFSKISKNRPKQTKNEYCVSLS